MSRNGSWDTGGRGGGGDEWEDSGSGGKKGGWGYKDDDGGSRGGRRDGGRGGDWGSGRGGNRDEEETFTVPSNMVGRVIGRGGQKIRELQDQSRCKINVDKNAGGDGQTSITISGEERDRERAKSLILDLTEDDGGSFSSGQGSKRSYDDGPRGGGGGGYRGDRGGGGGGGGHTVRIPSRVVGMIIGKGGSRIKDIEYEVNCSVKIRKAEDGTGDSVAEVHGDEDQFKQVKEIVEETIRKQEERDGDGGGGYGKRDEGSKYSVRSSRTYK